MGLYLGKKGKIWFFICLAGSLFMLMAFIGVIVLGVQALNGNPTDDISAESAVPYMIIIGLMFFGILTPTLILLSKWIKDSNYEHRNYSKTLVKRRWLKIIGTIVLVLNIVFIVSTILGIEVMAHPEIQDGPKYDTATFIVVAVITAILTVATIIIWVNVAKTKKQVERENMMIHNTSTVKKTKLFTTFVLIFTIIFAAPAMVLTPQILLGNLTDNFVVMVIVDVVSIAGFVGFLLMFITGLRTKVSAASEMVYHYDTKDFHIKYPEEGKNFDPDRFCNTFNDAHNQGYTEFIGFDGTEMVFKTSLTQSVLKMQKNNLERFKNGDKTILSLMPSYFISDGRIYYKSRKTLEGEAIEKRPYYKEVYDGTTVRETDTEIIKTDHYKEVLDGYEYYKIRHYTITYTFYDKTTNKQLVDRNGAGISWKCHTSESEYLYSESV